MKYFTFDRESENFDDILTDPVLKKVRSMRIEYPGSLMIGFDEENRNAASLISYITIKYCDDIKSDVVVDHSPKPYIDYIPLPQ